MIDRTIMPPVYNAVDFDFHLAPCQKDVFANGIPVYWLSAGTQDVVQIEWIFRAGLWGEEKNATAHATAALLKNGTRHKTAEVISEALEFYGASLKSVAGNDYSALVLHCLTKYLDKVLPVVKSIILEAAFPEKELEIYRKNALQHLSVNLKKVDFVANREADAQVFGYEHPYGRFSREEDLKSLSVVDLQSFHRKYYFSANCQIFIAGKLTQTNIADVATYFGKEPWGAFSEKPVEKTFALHPAAKKQFYFDLNENSVQGAVRILRHFPTRQHPDFAPMIVLNTLLGGYFGSRLMANIREEKGYTYGIYSMIYTYQKESCFTIATEAGKEVCGAVIDETRKEMQRLCREPVPQEELDLVKNYLFGNLLGSLDGPFNLIRRWKGLVLNDFSETHFYENIELYRKVTAVDLQALAVKYFQSEDFYEVLVQ